MPTGYTADVADGKVTDFTEFVLGCSRAFGALVTMRDDPKDAEIPDEFAADDYHAKNFAEAEQRLAKLKTMTPAEIAERMAREHEQQMQYWRESRRRTEQTKDRYNRMLAKVRDWKPPTPDHVGLKEFMIQQLEESVRFDCGSSLPRPERIQRDEWLLREIERASRDIEYHKAEHQKEVTRASERTAWVRALKESLKGKC